MPAAPLRIGSGEGGATAAVCLAPRWAGHFDPAAMDSVSQFVLGAAVVAATIGRHTTPRRAVLLGGLVATLPDLDVLWDHGDAVQNMVRHRAASHAWFWQTLATPVLAWLIARLPGERGSFLRWCLAVWLALVTHALLDALTIYGTRLWLPFADAPAAVGCLFVIDPLYTLPLLAGTLALWGCRDRDRAARWNRAGLWLSSGYAVWALVMQQVARAAMLGVLLAEGIAPEQLVVTPAPLQTVLWRGVAIDGDQVRELFWTPFDHQPVPSQRFERGADLLQLAERRGLVAVRDLMRLAGGCCKAARSGDRLLVSDLRMGQEPHYVFTFQVGEWRDGELRELQPTLRAGSRIEIGAGLRWLWPRMWGTPVPTPR